METQRERKTYREGVDRKKNYSEAERGRERERSRRQRERVREGRGSERS
jgi:hypothetical protein